MQRVASSVRQSSARRIACSIGGASAVVLGYHLYTERKPLLLDSGASATWQKTDARARLARRFRKASDAQAREAEDDVSDDTPPPQTRGHPVLDVPPSWGERLAGMLVPSWAKALPGLLNKLQDEMSMAPWSLSWEIWQEANDPQVNPEIVWDASVRLSDQLCPSEKDFLRKRKLQTAKALARYLGTPEQEVHPDDVPIIAICGSGGGLRALVAGTSSYLSAHESGLFDCATYTAGVSGSCWLQTLYYSSIGDLSHQKIIDHLKDRIGIHIASPFAALNLLNQAPTNKFLFSGFVEKLRGVPDSDFGLVDVYGLLLAARLMVPRGELAVNDYDLKVSNQRFYLDDGMQPLPIYTAVRHEIPNPPEPLPNMATEACFGAKHYDWFQWFEWTPYEFFCEELNAGIPTWAVGRKFEKGQTLWRENGLALPELRVPLMLGIWGSAFCATLSHYYKELRPAIKAAGWAVLDSMLSQKDEDLVKVHPVDPAVIPNFTLGLRDQLPKSTPEDIHTASHFQLMDAGMSNNLPIYPLLRPGRNVDVVIAFDASADVKTDNWIKAVDGYVRQRGIKGWPMGAGWPSAGESSQEIIEDMELAEAATGAHAGQTLESIQGAQVPNTEELGHCTVWVGTTCERGEYMDEPPNRRLNYDGSDDHHIRDPDAGVALIYFPLLKNDKIPGVDPMASEFMSTWNFVYTSEEIDKVVDLARANFEEGKMQTKRVIRAVWERKKAMRLRREKEETDLRRRADVRRGNAHAWRNVDHGQGDQFGGV